jgi:hypothetical protein
MTAMKLIEGWLKIMKKIVDYVQHHEVCIHTLSSSPQNFDLSKLFFNDKSLIAG